VVLKRARGDTPPIRGMPHCPETMIFVECNLVSGWYEKISDLYVGFMSKNA